MEASISVHLMAMSAGLRFRCRKNVTIPKVDGVREMLFEFVQRALFAAPIFNAAQLF